MPENTPQLDIPSHHTFTGNLSYGLVVAEIANRILVSNDIRPDGKLFETDPQYSQLMQQVPELAIALVNADAYGQHLQVDGLEQQLNMMADNTIHELTPEAEEKLIQLVTTAIT